jgi:pimeloyl-ACP methyl ester carboxylesterase
MRRVRRRSLGIRAGFALGANRRSSARERELALEHDLEAVIEALRLPRYALLGISQGAPVAIAHAERRAAAHGHVDLPADDRAGSSCRPVTADFEHPQRS